MFSDMSDIQHKDSHTSSATSHRKSKNKINKIFAELKCFRTSIQSVGHSKQSSTCSRKLYYDTDYSGNIARRVIVVCTTKQLFMYLLIMSRYFSAPCSYKYLHRRVPEVYSVVSDCFVQLQFQQTHLVSPLDTNTVATSHLLWQELL